MKDRTALVTGACGFSSSYLIPLLLENGWKVKATDLKSAPRNHIQHFSDKIDFYPADLTKKDSIIPLLDDIDVVFHTAAIFSYSAPMELLRKVNVNGTKNLLDSCLKKDVEKMVLWSSVAVYGNASSKFYPMPIPELSIEDLNPRIGGKYDLSKREQELAAREYWEENNFPITFMRLAPLYGPGSYYGIFTLIKYIKYEILPFAPNNLHNASVPLVHALDLARAAIHLSDLKKYNGEVYNIADDNLLDMIETFKYISALTNSNFRPLIPIPRSILFPLFAIIGAWSKFESKFLRKKINGKPPIPKIETDSLLYLFGNFWFDNTKLKTTGFEFKYPDCREGLLETIKWYDKNGWDKKLAMPGE